MKQTSLLGTALIAALSLGAPALAEQQPTKEAPSASRLAFSNGVYEFSIGAVRVIALADGSLPLDVRQVAVGLSDAQRDDLLAKAQRQPVLEGSINTYVVDLGSRKILVDSGLGDLANHKVGGHLLLSLKQAGIKPEQITDVVITHAHGDHLGGLIKDGKIVYKNATIHLAKAETDFFLDNKNIKATGYYTKAVFDRAQSILIPYQKAGKLKTFAGKTELAPGFFALPTPGHTPGHSFYRLENGGQAIEFWGDIVHLPPIQLPNPSITVGFDENQDAARAQRLSAFKRAASDHTLVAVTHFSFPGIGRLANEGTGYRFLPEDFKWRDAN